MGIILTLRDQEKLSYFKELMLDLLDLKIGNKVLICSGYFQENYTPSQKSSVPRYYVSKEKNYKGKTILDCIDFTYKEVTLVGSRAFRNTEWDHSYQDFVIELRKRYGAKPSIIAHRNIGGNWHAKVFILLKDEEPIAGIIGSSNLTKSAYGTGSNTYFSIEADTMLFIPQIQNHVNQIIEGLRIQEEEVSSIIIADYDPKKNNGRTEQDILREYYNKIIIEINSPQKYELF